MSGSPVESETVMAPFLKRYWVLFVLAGLLVLIVGSLLIVDAFAGGATASFQAGYDYGLRYAPTASRLPVTTSPTSRTSPLATTSQSTSSVFERCTTAARFETPPSESQTEWRTGCIAGWDKKSGHPTAGTEGMTTTTT